MKRSYLSHAMLEVTPACNLRCRHCYNWWKWGGEGEEVGGGKGADGSFRKAFAVLDHLIRHTTVERVVFTGGEPTVAERFPELVLHAKVHGLRVTVITNGNAEPGVYRQLADLGVDLVECSVLSCHGEVHDAITGVPGSWRRLVGNMRRLREWGVAVVPVVVATSLNAAYVPETVA